MSNGLQAIYTGLSGSYLCRRNADISRFALLPTGRERIEYPMPARDSTAVRTANLSDIAELVRIEKSCFDADRLTRRSFMRLIRRGSASVIVATIAGRISAYAVSLFRRNSRVLRLYSIAVDPQMSGIGFGARLVSELEREGRRRGCNRIHLEVKSGNARAIALYERLDFIRFGIREGYYADGSDAYRYVKRLGVVAL